MALIVSSFFGFALFLIIVGSCVMKTPRRRSPEWKPAGPQIGERYTLRPATCVSTVTGTADFIPLREKWEFKLPSALSLPKAHLPVSDLRLIRRANLRIVPGSEPDRIH
jgi:hypothetical protein